MSYRRPFNLHNHGVNLTKPEHEVACPNCHEIRICTCGNPAAHKRDEPFPYMESTWCQSCRTQYHDESRDFHDEHDQRAYDSEPLSGNQTDPWTERR